MTCFKELMSRDSSFHCSRSSHVTLSDQGCIAEIARWKFSESFLKKRRLYWNVYITLHPSLSYWLECGPDAIDISCYNHETRRLWTKDKPRMINRNIEQALAPDGTVKLLNLSQTAHLHTSHKCILFSQVFVTRKHDPDTCNPSPNHTLFHSCNCPFYWHARLLIVSKMDHELWAFESLFLLLNISPLPRFLSRHLTPILFVRTRL